MVFSFKFMFTYKEIEESTDVFLSNGFYMDCNVKEWISLFVSAMVLILFGTCKYATLHKILVNSIKVFLRFLLFADRYRYIHKVFNRNNSNTFLVQYVIGQGRNQKILRIAETGLFELLL